MRSHNVIWKIAILSLCLPLMYCASTRAPRGWLAQADKVPMDVYGAWCTIETKDGRLGGELIAASNESVFVADTKFHAVAVSDIRSARLAVYDVGGQTDAALVLGPLSTLSNGLLLALTMPMWLIGGPIVASSRSYDPIIDYPDRPLKEFVAFARFPQGLPAGLDRGTIRMKARSGKN